MVNAHNLKRPERPFVDVQRLVDMGLLDPAFGDPSQRTGLNLPKTLGFDPMGSALAPPEPVQGSVPQPFTVDPLKEQASTLRAKQQASLDAYGKAHGTSVVPPESVRPKRLSGKQVGIGAGVALALRGLGASERAVQNAFGSYVGSIVGANEEEANTENQRRARLYAMQIDGLKRQAEASKGAFEMSGALADDLDRQITDLTDRNDALTKSRQETGQKAITAFQKAFQDGTLDPVSLRQLEQAYFDSTGQVMFGLPGEREDAYAQAEKNYKRLGQTRNLELTKLSDEVTKGGVGVRQAQTDLDFDLQVNPLKLRYEEARTVAQEIETRIATASEDDRKRYFAAQALKAEADAEIARLRAEKEPTVLNLEIQQKKASIAYTWKLLNNVGKSAGSDPLERGKALNEAYLKAKDAGTNFATDTQLVNAQNELKSIQRAIKALVDSAPAGQRDAMRSAMPDYFNDVKTLQEFMKDPTMAVTGG